MSGPTIIMAPAMDSSSLSSRSHSTPDLLSFQSYQYDARRPSDHRLDHSDDSDPDLDFDLPSFGDNFELDTSLILTPPSPQQPDSESPRAVATPEPEPQPELNVQPQRRPSPIPIAAGDASQDNASAGPAPRLRPALRRSRTGSLMERPRSWFVSSMSSSKLSTSPSSSSGDDARPRTANGPAPDAPSAGSSSRRRQSSRPPSSSSSRTLSVPQSFSGFTKRGWLSPSRSSSPKRKPSPARDSARDRNDGAVSSSAASAISTDSSSTSASTSAGTSPGTASAPPSGPQIQQEQQQQPRRSSRSESSKPFSRASSYFSRMKPKKQSASKAGATMAIPDSDNASYASSASLAPPVSNTTDTQNSLTTSHDGSTAPSDDSSSDMSRLPQNTDPLWSSFKTLEVEHKNFLSKSMPHRITQIQNVVLPFLRNTMDHSSTRKLSPTDLDRRAIVLNGWWTALLEMVDGVGLSSVPGVDRPLVLETLTALMLRSEWRQTTPHYLPLDQRTHREDQRLHRERIRHLTKRPTHGSDDSFFADEAAEHNVRTMFITGLAKQLAFAVDKMSMRYCAPALVTFAGKTCAYAFFFLPGAADMLVRLWGLSPGLIRRAADELGLPRPRASAGAGADGDVSLLFPPNLAHLSWTSPKATWDMLKRVPQLPIIISRIAWTGPWMSRWKGRDTDLLFVFYKQYHLLVDDFLPRHLRLRDKARSPGFALVHAQLLSVLDDTIHRQAAMCYGGGSVAPQMMDGQLPGADASAMAMPMPPTNLMKGMTENSLVLLLRDMLLGDGDSRVAGDDKEGAKHTFAEACFAMVKAAVRRTSQFDNPACFTLCDFLEEALGIYSEFEARTHRAAAAAPNGLSSLAGGAGAGASSGSGSGVVGVGRDYVDWPFWIDVFRRILSSLNTMSEVRMLSFIYTIWDMAARDPARKHALAVDWLLTPAVFDTFFSHWCPMVRAYYHRLLCWRICRFEGGADDTDTKIFRVVAERLQTTWAHYLYLKQAATIAGRAPPSSAPMVPTPGKKFMIIRQEVNQPQPGLFVNFDSLARSPGSDVISGDDIAGLTAPKAESKKRSSLLGKVLSFGSGSKGAKADDEFATARREMAEQRARASKASASASTSASPHSSDSDSACSSPVYDEQRYVFKFFLAWQQNPMANRERILSRPRLPAPTQAVVSLEPGKDGSGSSSASDDDEQDDEDDIDALAEAAAAETEPIRPTGIAAGNAAYTGRAIAEWTQVVWECNSFVDRRCDEGCASLADVEVPILGVETFRKLGS